jgi:hypothetical protein
MRVEDITEESVIREQTVETEAEDLFEMANLYPDTTGLPMTVWISPRGNAWHDVRIKVNLTHGSQMTIANTAVVGVRLTLRVITGQLSPVDAQAVFRWIALNTEPLVTYWEGQIDTARVIQALNGCFPRHSRLPGLQAAGKLAGTAMGRGGTHIASMQRNLYSAAARPRAEDRARLLDRRAEIGARMLARTGRVRGLEARPRSGHRRGRGQRAVCAPRPAESSPAGWAVNG